MSVNKILRDTLNSVAKGDNDTTPVYSLKDVGMESASIAVSKSLSEMDKYREDIRVLEKLYVSLEAKESISKGEFDLITQMTERMGDAYTTGAAMESFTGEAWGRDIAMEGIKSLISAIGKSISNTVYTVKKNFKVMMKGKLNRMEDGIVSANKIIKDAGTSKGTPYHSELSVDIVNLMFIGGKEITDHSIITTVMMEEIGLIDGYITLVSDILKKVTSKHDPKNVIIFIKLFDKEIKKVPTYLDKHYPKLHSKVNGYVVKYNPKNVMAGDVVIATVEGPDSAIPFLSREFIPNSKDVDVSKVRALAKDEIISICKDQIKLLDTYRDMIKNLKAFDGLLDVVWGITQYYDGVAGVEDVIRDLQPAVDSYYRIGESITAYMTTYIYSMIEYSYDSYNNLDERSK